MSQKFHLASLLALYTGALVAAGEFPRQIKQPLDLLAAQADELPPQPPGPECFMGHAPLWTVSGIATAAPTASIVDCQLFALCVAKSGR
jgi:hypothetical protein